MRHWIAAAGLVAVGSAQMAGDVVGNPTLRAAGASTHASPAPKVFTAQNGFETFSSRFFIEWGDGRSGMQVVELTPRTYRTLEGPYNRRNAYGAALSYGPVLAANPRTRPMLEAVTRYAFCTEAPLLRELGVPRDNRLTPLRITLEPRESRSRAPHWQTTMEVGCEFN